MAKIVVCDVCLTRHDKLTRATKYMSVKGHKDLKIELCNVHSFEFNKKFSKVTAEYVQFVYEMVYKARLTPEDAQVILKSGRR